VIDYYSDLFTPSLPLNFDEVLGCVPARVTPEINHSLCRLYTCNEVDYALKQMHPHKARRP